MNEIQTIQRTSTAIFAEVGDDIIFLHENDGVYYSLDGVGAYFWKALETPRSLVDLMALIQKEYDIEEAELRDDLNALIIDLKAKGLLANT